MEILILWILILAGLFGSFSYILLIVLLRVVNRVVETNKTLLFLVAGKDEKPETLRALVASQKHPQGKLKGIATQKKKDDKLKNTNYTMSIGI